MGTFNFKKFITLSGKVGPLVLYATKEGKQLFRTYTKPANPRTPRQTAHRARFGLVNKALSPLNNVIKQGYPGEKNAYRTLVGKALREAVEGEYPHLVFNYGKIQIARGQLPVPPDCKRSTMLPPGNCISAGILTRQPPRPAAATTTRSSLSVSTRPNTPR